MILKSPIIIGEEEDGEEEKEDELKLLVMVDFKQSKIYIFISNLFLVHSDILSLLRAIRYKSADTDEHDEGGDVGCGGGD